jgi:outer membrane protein OmpA-like peptidoglycan-associated protein
MKTGYSTVFSKKGGRMIYVADFRKGFVMILVLFLGFMWGCSIIEYRGGAAYSPSEVAQRYDTITLHLHFTQGNATIQANDYRTLDGVISLIKNHPHSEIIVEGHTDNVGDRDLNHELSHKRANAVKRYFVDSGGLDETNIRAIGYGEKKPIASNATAAGRYQNRRVEIRLVSD